MKFGSDELHLALQNACDAGDLSRAAELLYEPVRMVSRFLFVKHRDSFAMYTFQDKEDAIIDALLYMLDKLPAIAHPQQEGTPKASYYYKFIFYGLCKRKHRIIQEAQQSSLDAPASRSGSDGDDRERFLIDTIGISAPRPDEIIERNDTLHHALKAFFALNNDPETIISIAFIVLNEQLGLKPMALKEYVEFFNGQKVSKVLNSIEMLLKHHKLDASILAPVKKRLAASGTGAVFSGLTEGKLANRKNSILSKLRLLKPDDDD